MKDPKVGEPKIHNGADDNASGNCRHYGTGKVAYLQPDLKYNVLFIAFVRKKKA